MKQRGGIALFFLIMSCYPALNAQVIELGSRHDSRAIDNLKEKRLDSFQPTTEQDFVICQAYTFQVQKRLERLVRHVQITRQAYSPLDFEQALFTPHSLSKGQIQILKLNELGQYEYFNPQHQHALNVFLISELHNNVYKESEIAKLPEIALYHQMLKTIDFKIGAIKDNQGLSSKNREDSIQKLKELAQVMMTELQALQKGVPGSSFSYEDYSSLCSKPWLKNISLEQSLALVELYQDKTTSFGL